MEKCAKITVRFCWCAPTTAYRVVTQQELKGASCIAMKGPLHVRWQTSSPWPDLSAKCRFCSLMSQGVATLILSGCALPLGACVLCVLDGT